MRSRRRRCRRRCSAPCPERRVLQRVGQQVGDDREHLLLVHPRGQPLGRLEHEALLALLGDAGEALAARAHEAGHVDVAWLELEVAAVQARDLQQLLDALEQDVGVGADALDVLGLPVAELGGGQQPAAEPEHDRERRLELVADAGQQFTALLVERARPTRERAGFEIAAAHVIDAAPASPRSARELPLSESCPTIPCNPPGSCTSLLRYVRNQSGTLPHGVGKFVPHAPAASSPRRRACKSPAVVGGRGYVPRARSKRHDALPIVRLSHKRLGGGRADRPHAALRPPGGSPSTPQGAARAAVG